jgi:hypothetical protein
LPVPADEQDEVFAMRMSLLILVDLVEDYRAALDLFVYSQGLATSNPDHSAAIGMWRRVALRDSLITLDQFDKTLKLPLRNRPWLGLVDTDRLASARNHFDQTFPDVVAIRHSIFHRSEMVASALSINLNASTRTQTSAVIIVGGGNGMMVGLPGTYVNDTYAATHKGKLVTYSFTAHSLSELEGVMQETLSAFSAL